MEKVSKNGRYTQKTIDKMRKAKLGKKRDCFYVTDEYRRKLSDAKKGDKCYLWKGGITTENHKIRQSLEYKTFVRDCLTRDGFTCQVCKVVGGNLEVHHIKSFSKNKELRTDITNGVTLCKNCHSDVDEHRFISNTKT